MYRWGFNSWGGGGLVEIVSFVSQACLKRRLIGAVCRNHHIKRLVPCRCLDGHVKEPYEMSMALGARPQVRLLLLQSACTSMCRHISLILTLNNQFTSPQPNSSTGPNCIRQSGRNSMIPCLGGGSLFNKLDQYYSI